MRQLIYSLGLSLIAGILISCNYTRLKESADSFDKNLGKLEPGEESRFMNYSFIDSRIFQPKCTGCHGTSRKVNLETYASVKTHLAEIRNSVFVEKTMPKRGALTKEEARLLWNWIKLGAPLLSQEPPPPVDPLIATYESIRRHVFEPKCITCHNPTGKGKRILLDREALLDSPLELVLVGNADESGLIIALERKDDKRMPPEEEGYTALKPEVIEIFREWINNGAE